MHKKFSERSFADYVYWQMQDKKTLRRIILNAEVITATNNKSPSASVGGLLLDNKRISL